MAAAICFWPRPSYEYPTPECPKIGGLICFDESRVRVGAEVS